MRLERKETVMHYERLVWHAVTCGVTCDMLVVWQERDSRYTRPRRDSDVCVVWRSVTCYDITTANDGNDVTWKPETTMIGHKMFTFLAWMNCNFNKKLPQRVTKLSNIPKRRMQVQLATLIRVASKRLALNAEDLSTYQKLSVCLH